MRVAVSGLHLFMDAGLRVCVYVCIYVCVCKYACMYVCLYVCMYVCMYVFMYLCIYACMHARTHSHTHALSHRPVMAEYNPTLILVSPMRRALQTCLLALEPAPKAPAIIVLPVLLEGAGDGLENCGRFVEEVSRGRRAAVLHALEPRGPQMGAGWRRVVGCRAAAEC